MTQFTNLNTTSLITFAVLKMVPKSALWRFETSAYLWRCSIVDTYVPIWCRYLVQITARRCFVRILLPGFHVCSCRVKLILLICLPFDWCLVPIISVAVASSHLQYHHRFLLQRSPYGTCGTGRFYCMYRYSYLLRRFYCTGTSLQIVFRWVSCANIYLVACKWRSCLTPR